MALKTEKFSAALERVQGAIGHANCANCGHSWFSHAYYDNAAEQYVTAGCDHWSGCKCRQWEVEAQHGNA